MSKFKIKKPFLAFAVPAALFSMNVHSDELGRVEMHMAADIRASTCSVRNPSLLIRKIPDQDLAEMQKLKQSRDAKVINIDHDISIVCPRGTSAEFRIDVNKNDICTTDNNLGFVCSGTNKTVGMAPSISWRDRQGSLRRLDPFTDKDSGVDRPLERDTMAGDSATISIKLKSVHLRTIQGKNPSPGDIAAKYTIILHQY